MLSRSLLIVLIQLSSVAGLTQPHTTHHVQSGSKHDLKLQSSVRNDEIVQEQRRSSLLSSSSTSRRNAIVSCSSSLAALVLGLGMSPEKVLAFPNRVSEKYSDRPKRKGPKPRDLGVKKRTDLTGEEYIGLKNCGPAPNCFCSTDSPEDDPEHYIPAFNWPKEYGSTEIGKTKAFVQLQEVLNKYQPGQSNVDGGGFQIIEFDADKGYIYAQFESLKQGYIDDLELAYTGTSGQVQVRSSSRVGYLDFSVNAKRINYIAKCLRDVGWDATGVDFDKHQDYVIQNSAS